MSPPDHKILDALRALFEAFPRKKIPLEDIMRSVPGPRDIKSESTVLECLEYLDAGEKIKLPSKRGKGWQPFGFLPRYVTRIRPDEDLRRSIRQKERARLREQTPWEWSKMAAFAHTLTTQSQLAQARAVNQYLLNRPDGMPLVPHRERALGIFGDEKALDGSVHKGLFSGRITLKDLDCFYCPEPLPYERLSPAPEKTESLPLLLVENSATYWSCCRANRSDIPQGGRFFAAVVFGKGFRVTRDLPRQSLDSLRALEIQTSADGILYFGDLDPAGLDIPKKINANREKHGLPGVRPAVSLYQALLKKDLKTDYKKNQTSFHDAKWVQGWLGEELAGRYLKDCHRLRWPQEGLSADDIARAMAGNCQNLSARKQYR